MATTKPAAAAKKPAAKPVSKPTLKKTGSRSSKSSKCSDGPDPEPEPEDRWIDQMRRDAERFEQPPSCLPVADGVVLDQLLTKLRVAADNEFAFESPEKTEQAVRALADEPMWHVGQQMYDHLDELIAAFKTRWRPENHGLLEKARAWTWRRQGWHVLLSETETCSVVASADLATFYHVRGLEASLAAKVREKHDGAEMPVPVYLTLLPWEGKIGTDGLIVGAPFSKRERLVFTRFVRPRYRTALEAAAGEPEGSGGLWDGPWATEKPPRGTLLRSLPPSLAWHDRPDGWPGALDEPICRALTNVAKESADAAARDGKWADAAEGYSVALTAYGAENDEGIESATLLCNRALCHEKLGDHGAALIDAVAATRAAPGWPKGWMRKALQLQALGQLDEAVMAADRAVEAAPADRGLAALRDEMVEARGQPRLSKSQRSSVYMS